MWPHSRLRTPLDVDLVYSRLGFFIESWKAAKGPDTEKLQSCGGILMGEVPTRAGNKPLHDFLLEIG
ncbi:FACT complex subunit spt16 [Puccinia graminis f. sp. tritici]|uniref:FACT complex subunit spt16 n=1 Tax=Puccinia graminis f. sp. tritici TaxID=56615 RepID=A0A5B0R7E7_PUCGR|nr:FACT complex subunit spt16 [Puccinia graminis f. sp. tritici]